MKRVGWLFEKIADPKNVKSAIVQTVKNKKRPKRYRRYIERLDEYVEKVVAILKSGDYSCLGNDREFDRIGGHPRKERHIQAPRFFPDQIIHRALCNVMEPILLKGRDKHSHCGIKGRGTYSAYKDIRHYLRKHPRARWCLKVDIRKFYPSVDREVCIRKIERKIKDEKTLALCRAVIRNAKSKGLPIGYSTSPRFGETLLEEHDRNIRKAVKPIAYSRYADDMILLGSSKRKLKEGLRNISACLHSIGLRLNDHTQLFRIDHRPIDFVGFRYWKEGYVRVRKHVFSSILSMLRRIRKAGHATVSQAEAYVSRMAMFLRCGSKNYYVSHMKPVFSTGFARSLISNHAKRKEGIA